MKELSIKEKARRYDEALKVLHKYDGANIMFSQSLKEEMFPELKESEDERIKNIIKKSLRVYFEGNLAIGTNDTDYAECLAWLEKQGNLIVELQKTYAEIGRLVKENCYLKEKQCEQKPVEWSGVDNAIVEGICLALEYSNESGEAIEKYENWLHSIKDRILPLNEVLKQKPADKVEPKFKVGDTITDPTDSTFTFHINKIEDGRYIEKEDKWVLVKEADANYELVEQKPTWSEEDESRIITICTYLQDYARLSGSELRTIRINEYCDWLKSLRHRSQWKPSDEQLNALYDAAVYVDKSMFPSPKGILMKLFKQLMKLRE